MFGGIAGCTFMSMVICSHCQTANSLDSHFCKQCGKEVPEAERQQAQAKLAELISEGYKAFSEGRTEEALLISENALGSEPSNANALSLKGMCFERNKRYAEALECFEQVVRQNPDSALDRIKVTHLRNTISAKLVEEPQAPDKRRILLASISATVLVVASGIAIGGFANWGNPDAGKRTAELSKPQPNPFDLDSRLAAGGGVSTSNSGESPAAQPQGGSGSGSEATGSALPPSGGQVPGISGSRTPPWQPPELGAGVVVRPEGAIPGGSDSGAGTGGGSGTLPNVGGSTGGNAGSNRGPDSLDPGFGAQTPPDTGIIDIRVSKPDITGGGQSVDPQTSRNQAEALLRTARDLFLAGKFADAARTYEAALRAGSDPASTNQRLAQCYAKLGRKSDALNAYTKAIASYESQIASGTGNASVLKASLDACKQSLLVLRGGG